MNDWIQAILTLISSIIIVFVTVIVNKRTHYDKEWWQKKVIKYEKMIEVLSDLEEHYGALIFEIEEPNIAPGENEMSKPISLLMKELDNIANISEFYFNEKTAAALKEVKEKVHDVEILWGIEDECKLYKKALHEIRICKNVIIKQTKSDLRLKNKIKGGKF